MTGLGQIPGERLFDWSERLNDYLLEARFRPHEYGQHDCLLHPAAIVKAATGVDLAEAHRGAYRSAAGAVRHLRQLGFASPEELLDSLFEEVPIGFAQRADLVLTPADVDGGWPIPGACIGGVAFCVGPLGFLREPRARWLKAWKVGR